MCTKCKDILIRAVQKHSPMTCPIVRSSYCSICATYGHTTLDCPDEAVLEHRVPEYVEQLIPHSILDMYNIKSRTPLLNKPTVDPDKPKAILEVYDTDKCIRTILMNYNKPFSGKAKENKIRIQHLADELGRKLVFVKPPKAEGKVASE